jgi:hypothetical protein
MLRGGLGGSVRCQLNRLQARAKAIRCLKRQLARTVYATLKAESGLT